MGDENAKRVAYVDVAEGEGLAGTPIAWSPDTGWTPTDEIRRHERDQLHARVERDHTFHPVAGDAQRRSYEAVRARARELAHFLIDTVPGGRELSTSLTRLEEVVFHANAGIARGGPS